MAASSLDLTMILTASGVLIAAIFALRNNRTEIVAASTQDLNPALRATVARFEAEAPGQASPKKRGAAWRRVGAIHEEIALRALDEAAAWRSLDALTTAAAEYRQAGKPKKANEALWRAALVANRMGRLMVAPDLLQRAAAFAEDILGGDKDGELGAPRDFFKGLRALVLAELGLRAEDEDFLRDALAICEKSRVAIVTRYNKPEPQIDANAALVLRMVGEAFGDRAILVDAVGAARRAYKKLKGNAEIGSAIRDTLGSTLAILAAVDGSPKMAAEAVEHLEASLKAHDTVDRPAIWAEIALNLNRALTVRGRLERDPTALARAMKIVKDVLEIFTAEAAPFQRAEALDCLGDTLYALAEQRGDRDIAGMAADAFTRAAGLLGQGPSSRTLRRILGNIDRAERLRQGHAA